MVGVAAASAGGIEMGLVRRADRAMPVVQHGVEAGQAGARAEEQRQQQQRPDSRHVYAASLTLGLGHRGTGTGQPPEAVRGEEEQSEHADDDRPGGQVVVERDRAARRPRPGRRPARR